MGTSLSTAPLWSYGLASVSHLAFALHFLRWRHGNLRDPVDRALLGAAVATLLWAAEGFLLALQPLSFLFIAHAVFDSLRYAGWYVFIILLLRTATSASGREQPFRAQWPMFVGLASVTLALVFQALLATDLLVAEVAARGAQYAALAQSIFGLVLIEQLFRNTTSDSRWQIKPLGIGLAAVFGFDLYFHSTVLLFNRIDNDSFTVRGLATVLVLPLIILTVYRTRARQLRIAVSQKAAFQTTSLAIAGLYLLIASAAGYYVRYLGGSWGGALQIAVLFAAMLLMMVLMFSGTMRARIKVLIGKNFFRYRYDYREEWLKFTRTLSSGESAQQAGQQVIRGLADMVESPAGTLWLLDGDGSTYRQNARWNMPECTGSEPADGSLVRFLETSGWVINLEEYRHRPSRYQNLTLPEWLLETPNAWLIVPLSLPSKVVGFVVLATARAPLDIDWEVNDLLRTAGRQAAAFLAQLQAAEALLEARKFDAFNKMSAFVVHDLKNIVTQLSLMLKNAERHAGNPEFQRDMIETVDHAVTRMKQLMMQLREGAKPAEGVCGVDLAAIAQRVKKAKAHLAPPVDVKVHAQVFARGHEERIERVIGHLVQNALEATPPDGRVWIDIGRAGSQATIEVGDTGHGMSAEFIRERLFKPFQTTKQSGMGIGAFESRQYIQELGGDICVESAENSGTRFLIRLPLIEVSKSSDLQQAEHP
ncbi:XrtA/PEP-CTERM system histidine kinase PrsK [Sulfuricystis multivorans]|uniref:XrtA/PEP-CTERM system histidine kinase PrsK n=1 Tax=Sulfuricystis multivorans TaxID=2211108 RepID=UPI000F82590E|nr:XrtA/PEP-CTERM system histidine kinase PrsK [Sulfuricystis multivorans]